MFDYKLKEFMKDLDMISLMAIIRCANSEMKKRKKKEKVDNVIPFPVKSREEVKGEKTK